MPRPQPEAAFAAASLARSVEGADELVPRNPPDVEQRACTIDELCRGTILDAEGVAVRTGHHCCQPLMARFGITGTVRASFAVYNTRKDVEALAEATARAASMLR